MLSKTDYLRYFHAGVTPSDTSDYEVEVAVEQLLARNTQYRVSLTKLDEIKAGVTTSLESTEIALHTLLGGGYNPNSNKDVASKIASLGISVPIVKTAKGNISITREWLEANQNHHPLFHLTASWRKFNKTLSTIESIREHCVELNDIPHSRMGTLPHITTNWKTYAPNGSGRIVSEAYPITQMPLILRPIVQCRPERVWANISIPHFDLKIIASLAHDSRFCQDLQDKNPLLSLATHLELPGDQQDQIIKFFNTMFYETYDEFQLASILGEKDLTFLNEKYPDLYGFLDVTILKAISRKLVPMGFFERVRDLSLDPDAKDVASLRRKALSSLCQQNIAFFIKRLTYQILEELPYLDSEYWIPSSMGVSFTVPSFKTAELKSALTGIFAREFGSWPVPINADVSLSENWLDHSEGA